MNAPAQPPQLPPNVTAVEIEDGDQPWCEIRLKDGNKLRVQINVAGVYRNDAEHDAHGLPSYTVMSALNVQAFKR